ncbi:unnamed protein product [Eruca vesicaria subsp. sativa]|uniref:Uncharacterized protein n=1 Tax=Eruca vesicaria subsp. sativa TaxID=29727 RepID=A0ABC8JMH6_ERUVS|nr:unnamed protein product [Eruca vesicaria subsp. sativa]
MNECDRLPLPDLSYIDDGDDDNGDDTPWNTSTLPKVGVEGNKCVEKSSAETSSSGPATEKPLLSATSKVVKKTRKALVNMMGVFFSSQTFSVCIMLRHVGFFF